MLGVLAGCGSGGGSSAASGGALNGNWQFNLVQTYPGPSTQLSASGFLAQSGSTLTGSVQGPVIINGQGIQTCGGNGTVSGTLNGQAVSFSLNPGGTVFNFTGTVSGNNSMTGTYQGLGGACFSRSTTGTFTAQLIPAITGNFTGTLNNSTYMEDLTGENTPIPVSGTLTQSASAGGSNASVSGTITAVGYPCMTTAYLTGTISGQSVYLDVFNFNGVQIGTLGRPSASGFGGNPAIVVVNSSGLSLTGVGSQLSGLSLGLEGTSPCPEIFYGGGVVTTDQADVNVTIQ